MTNKEYLIEFSKGNCSPVIILPALTATKLMVEINCQELKTYNNKIFKTCGFTQCKKEFWEFWKHVPQKEYLLWLSELFTPVSALTLWTSVSDCLASFMSLKVDFDKRPEDSLVE